MGHAVDDVNAIRAKFNKRFGKLRALTTYARHDPVKEAFEEAFAIFHADPDWLAANHKDMFDWLTAVEAGREPP